jgi:phosphoglycolate phosphatase
MLVAFDLDGTLVDPKEGIVSCVEYALDRLGIEAPSAEDLAKHIGPPLQDTFRTLLGPGDDARVHKAVSYYRERFAVSGIYENTVYPGIPEALDQLRSAGVTLYVVTSKPTNYARKIIGQFELAASFRKIIGGEMNGTRSDKADLIDKLVRSELVGPADLVMVGDRKHDIAGARKHGVRSVGVLWGYGTYEELEAAGADWICGTPGDLPSLLVEKIKA